MMMHVLRGSCIHTISPTQRCLCPYLHRFDVLDRQLGGTSGSAWRRCYQDLEVEAVGSYVSGEGGEGGQLGRDLEVEAVGSYV